MIFGGGHIVVCSRRNSRPTDTFESRVRLEVSERIRGEVWSFFDTDPAGPVPNSDYELLGNRFQLGLRVTREPVEVAYDSDELNATAFGFVPTAGGFEISANREIADIQVAGVSLTAKEALVPRTNARLFWIYYRDDRSLPFVDNRAIDARVADAGEPAEIHTVGAHVAHVVPAGPGKLDLLAWAAGQVGDWQSLEHRAWAYALEAGYQVPDAALSPWLRAGIDSGSGDGDPADGLHATFYQLLPTARTYAQFPFYNMMNNQDVFAQLVLRPHPMVSIRSDLHWLRVTSSRDLLYAGGGPTGEHVFGYSGTATGRRNGLAYVADIGVTVTPTDFLTIYGYYAHAFGQGVIRQAFRGDDADFAYVEATVAF